MARGDWSIADSGARFEVFGGPCCDDLECPSREGWQYPGETREQMVARLRSKYAWRQPLETDNGN